MNKINNLLREEIKNNILSYLMKNDMSFTEILNKIGMRDHGQLNYHLKLSFQEGLLERKDRKYLITDLGKKMGIYLNQFKLEEMYPLPVVCPIAKTKDGRILMVRRAKHPEKGTWGFPGGKIRIGETHFEAAEREFEEETGLKLKAKKVLGYFPTSIFEKGKVSFHVLLIPVLMERLKGNEEIKIQDEHDGYEFIKKTEWKKYPFTSVNKELLSLISDDSFKYKEFSVKR